MANIVEELRKPWTVVSHCQKRMREAADEIERLRDELDLMHKGVAGVYLKGHMDGVEKMKVATHEGEANDG